MTDAFAEGWQVRPLEQGPQAAYQVLPADYTIRGIPLAAGHHHLMLEYRPFAYEMGKWISNLS